MRGQGKIGTLAIWIIMMYLVVQCWVFFFSLENASTTGKPKNISMASRCPKGLKQSTLNSWVKENFFDGNLKREALLLS